MSFRFATGSTLAIVSAAASLALAAACGSRTGLDLEDVATLEDAGKDAPADVRHDRALDALPPIDSQPLPDVNRNDCPDASITFIYVITAENELFSFNPNGGNFVHIGTIACPAPPGATPFSMAVDRKGAAYVVFQNVDPQTNTPLNGDGLLFRVSTATAACIRTPYQPGQQGIFTFGMGFASDTNGPAETLYVASDDNPVLGSINVTSFGLNVVGPFNPPIDRAELTGTGDGRLFAFYALDPNDTAGGSAIAQIDKTTGAILAQSVLPQVNQNQHWAFGFWGGDFYTFTGPQGVTEVQRFRPADGSVTSIAQLNGSIVGAGVSTCAPEF
jgi:hypothetical protein